mmetsp:Transcript_10939/g.30001  ORF Transcript_10939/g.30001 Transcript_10939/m.30001 type:complete len:128 (+) Transcript_10939:375-758(+)
MPCLKDRSIKQKKPQSLAKALTALLSAGHSSSITIKKQSPRAAGGAHAGVAEPAKGPRTSTCNTTPPASPTMPPNLDRATGTRRACEEPGPPTPVGVLMSVATPPPPRTEVAARAAAEVPRDVDRPA